MLIHNKLLIMVFLMLLTALPFTGCRHFEAKPINASDNLSRLEKRSLTDSGLRKFVETNLHKTYTEWPQKSWDFQMLTLAALYNSPELEIARAKSYEAEAAKITAGERPNPSIGVTPAYNTSNPSGGTSPWILGLVFDFPIETAGKRGDRLTEAGYLSDAAKMGIAATAWEIRANVKKSMIALWSARKQEILVKQKLEAVEELMRISSAQFKAGDIDKSELMRVQIIAEQARLEYGDLAGRANIALMNLAGAVSLAPYALDGMNIDLSNLEQTPPEIPSSDARRKALLNRADILISLSEYAASESALRLEIAKQYPDFHLNPGYEFDQGDNKWQIGFQLTLPVFNNNRGAIAEADAKRNTAAATFNALQAKVLNDIENAVVTFQTEQGKLANADSIFESSQRQAELIGKQYEAGEISKQVEILARLDNLIAALSRIDLQVKTQESLGELEQSLQTPLDATTLPAASTLMEVK
jgi:outer membrane protein, heavy metal efflux system